MYQYPVLKRLSNRLMTSGKRTVSDRIIIEAGEILKKNGYNEPFKSRVEAIDEIKPWVELRTQKKSGQRVQIPSAMTPSRQEGSGLRRLKDAASSRKKNGKSGNYSYHLAQELIGILRSTNTKAVSSSTSASSQGSQANPSLALGKRDTQHRMAIAQRGSLR